MISPAIIMLPMIAAVQARRRQEEDEEYEDENGGVEPIDNRDRDRLQNY